MLSLPTTATSLAGTLSEPPPPPHPEARTTTTSSSGRGRKRRNLMSVLVRSVAETSRTAGSSSASRCLASLQDSIDQPDCPGKSVVASQADLAAPHGVHRGVDSAPQLLQLLRAQDELPDRRLAAPEDEIVGPQPRHLDLRLLDRKQVLDRLRQRPVPVLERRLELAQLVLRLGEGEPPVHVDPQRLRADILLRNVGVDPCVDAYRPRRDPALAL